MGVSDEYQHLCQLHTLTQVPGWLVSDPIPPEIINHYPLDRLLEFAVTCQMPDITSPGFHRLSVIEWLKRHQIRSGPDQMCRMSTAIQYLHYLTHQDGWSTSSPIPPAILFKTAEGLPKAGCALPKAGCALPKAGCALPKAAEGSQWCTMKALLEHAILRGDQVGCDPIPVIEWLSVQIGALDCSQLCDVFRQCPDLRRLRPLIEHVQKSDNRTAWWFCEPIWMMIADTECAHLIKSPIGICGCTRPGCLLDRCTHKLLQFAQAGISVGWVASIATMDSYWRDRREQIDYSHFDIPSTILQAMDHVLFLSRPQLQWLGSLGLDVEDALHDYRKREYGIAFATAIESDFAGKLDNLISWTHGPDYLDHCGKLTEQLLSVAVNSRSIRVIGDLLTKAAARLDQGVTIAFSADVMQSCLRVLVHNVSGKTKDEYLAAAIRCGADYVPLHDQLLQQFPRSPDAWQQVGVTVIPERVNAIFWSMMTRGDDDLRTGCQLFWEYYAPYICPAGIFETVDRYGEVYDKTAGSRWDLALQIDPDSCCYVTTRMNLDRTLMELMDLPDDGSGRCHELESFLSRFPIQSCPQSSVRVPADQDSLVHEEMPQWVVGHRLDLFANHSRAMTYAIQNQSEFESDRTISIVSALVAASQRNAVGTEYASYHLHEQTLLIIDSEVAQNTWCCEMMPSITYCNLRVTGISLSSNTRGCPPSALSEEQVLFACQRCVTLTSLIWRKQHDQHASEIGAMRAELNRLSDAHK